MCWGVQDHNFCELCRQETALEINWLGCQLEFCEVDSPVCQNPIISKLITYCSCQTCQTEAYDGGNPDDIYPEPFAHPGFSDTKPVIPVDRVQFPEPTAYESFSNVENLAGSADELPSYEDAMNEIPSPPSYDLTLVRDNPLEGVKILSTAHRRATRRYQQLMHVAKKRRQDIRRFLNQNPPTDTIRILDYATEVIESFLFDQEQRLSRMDLLARSFLAIREEIDLLPSSPQMALLEHKRQSIIREMEGYVDQDNTLGTAEVWDLRLESLLNHVGVEMVSASLQEIRDMMASIRAMRANASST
ncbi:unnamed protein product [Aureobasidium vineae]|uniref:Uncharacterized protein n=1 Tax=Aureobasidium vineae TaxID=2773715 RepID=A0A9N8P4S5_9PEZI|nr:unnamed protein product [Aureobasidium vineae]